MPTISELLGLVKDRPRWTATTAWEVKPGDLVRVGQDDVRLAKHVWHNVVTGEVTIHWGQDHFSDLERDATCKVKRWSPSTTSITASSWCSLHELNLSGRPNALGGGSRLI